MQNDAPLGECMERIGVIETEKTAGCTLFCRFSVV